MNPLNEPTDLNSILDQALAMPPDSGLPPAFTDLLVKKVEKRLTWRMVITEFALKTGVVAGVLIILLVALLFPFNTSGSWVLEFLVSYWQGLTGVGLIVLFTFLIDQVFLRFLFSRNSGMH